MKTARQEAERLIAQAPNDRWLRELTGRLDRAIRTDPLDRFMTLWDLSAAEAGRAFAVSRQAVAKWRRDGVPADRTPVLADYSTATDVLEQYVRRDRIPAVVRRPAPMLGDRSLYDLAMEGRHSDVLDEVSSMFDLRRVQP